MRFLRVVVGTTALALFSTARTQDEIDISACLRSSTVLQQAITSHPFNSDRGSRPEPSHTDYKLDNGPHEASGATGDHHYQQNSHAQDHHSKGVDELINLARDAGISKESMDLIWKSLKTSSTCREFLQGIEPIFVSPTPTI